VREVLADAGSDLRSVRRVAEDLDEAQDLRDAPQQAEACPLGATRGIRVVAQVGVVSVAGDLVLDDGGPGGIQRFLTDLLGKVIEGVVHGELARTRRWRDHSRLRPICRVPFSTLGARLQRWRSFGKFLTEGWRRQI
jgi:hypothetical protein